MEYRIRKEPKIFINCSAGRWLNIQIPTKAPGMPPSVQNPGPSQKPCHDFGISSRNCFSERNWLHVDRVCSRGAWVIGSIKSRHAAPTAENPKPDRPLIRPDTKRISSMEISSPRLSPATTVLLLRVAYATTSNARKRIATDIHIDMSIGFAIVALRSRKVDACTALLSLCL